MPDLFDSLYSLKLFNWLINGLVIELMGVIQYGVIATSISSIFLMIGWYF